MPNVTHYATNGTATVYATLDLALAAAGTTPCTLVLAPGSHTITGTTPSIALEVALRFDPEATIALANGQTVTINGQVEGPFDTLFTWTGTGKVLFRKGAVPQVYPEWWGARGDGSDATNSRDAIQAAIGSCAAGGGVVHFSAGRYSINSALVLTAEHSGIILQGSGRAQGATPATNYGSWIEYTASSGEGLKIGPPTTSDPIPGHIVVKDLAIQATHASYNGNLVDLRRSAWITFENVGFFGLPAATSATAAALVYGNEWVDITFDRCHFEAAVTGVKKASLGGSWLDYANCVYFDNCWFVHCTTSADFPAACQSVSFDRCIVEPAFPVGGVTSASLLSMFTQGGSINQCWFGDADAVGTWVKLGGASVSATGNFFSTGAVGIEVVAGTVAASVESNVFTELPVGVLVKASANTRVAGNSFAVPTSGIAVDVHNDTSAEVADNFVQSTGTSNIGYKLRSGTAGILSRTSATGVATPVDDLSGGAWAISSSPGRVALLKSLTDQATNPPLGNLDFLVVIGRYEVQTQGFFELAGSGGNPASSTKFIGSGGTANDMFVNAPGRIYMSINGDYALQLNKNTSTDDDSAAVLLIRQSGGTWTAKRVVQRAADSAGTGFRQLAVAN